jgi:predicted N-acetyltransferase YhbS
VALDDDGRIVGYASVSGGSLTIDELPAATARKLPRYPMPVLRLARLAVDTSVQGRGVGAALLRFVLDLAVDMAERYGCLGVVVDAKQGAEKFYAAYGFEAVELVEGESAARPRPTPMFLPLHDILGAR